VGVGEGAAAGGAGGAVVGAAVVGAAVGVAAAVVVVVVVVAVVERKKKASGSTLPRAFSPVSRYIARKIIRVAPHSDPIVVIDFTHRCLSIFG